MPELPDDDFLAGEDEELTWEDAPASALREIIVITGMSGAGRSEAIHTFEDLGYFCIDNLPPSFIVQLVNLTALPGSRVQKVAFVCDVRSGAYFADLANALEALESAGHSFKILYLTADERTLVRRFKETRRRHPLAVEGSLVAGIRAERELVQLFEARADVVLDTSTLRPQELRAFIRERFMGEEAVSGLSVTVSSFGFKYGVPIDADIVMDVRFLPNPHYIPRLREHTGLERPVRQYVLGMSETDDFLARWYELMDLLLPGYVREGKSQLHIALGCTGGMHRSVVLAEQTALHLRRHGYTVTVGHRDITRDKERS